MYAIVAGQRVVTAREFLEAAAGFEPLPEDGVRDTADLEARRDALSGLLEDLRAEASTEVDDLDVAYYEQLLRRMPTPMRRRKAGRRGAARKAVAA